MSAHPVQCECCAPGCDCGCVDACPTHHGRAAEPDPPREEHGEVLTSAQIGEPCPACAGTAPTHTCESYDPAAARRGAAMVRRRASCRVLGWRLWDLPGGDRLVLLPSYGGWILRADDDNALDITRDSARLILRGLLLSQLIEEARRMSQADYLRARARL